MEIRSILVSVGLGSQHNALTYAARLAEAYGAQVVGLAAGQPNLTYAGIDGAQAAAEFYATESKTIEDMLARAEERFHAAMPPSIPVRWRSYLSNTTEMLVDHARSCDVVVAAAGDVVQPGEMLDAGHLILASGRPVIMVGDNPRTFGLERVVIAWKDTREARRAVTDALPLLKRAKSVKVVTRSEDDMAAEAGSLSDIVEWLKRHDVEAESQLVEQGMHFLDAIGLLTTVDIPDLIVAGGYGHSRFREWLFGGVTADLLKAKNVNRLFSN